MPRTRRAAALEFSGWSCAQPQGTVLAHITGVKLSVISGSANWGLATSVAEALGVALCRRSVHRFADGELHVDIEESVREHDVYVVQPTSPPVDEHVMEVLFLADACRRAGAARLTAILPYFGYARQDRRTSRREAVGARVIADLIEAAGYARLVAIDLHTPAIEGFFHIPLEHLSAVQRLADAVRATSDSVIVAPDLGAVKLAERFRSLLHLPVAVVHKTRVTGTDVLIRSIIGDVKDRAPIVVDDMISTGGTVEAAVKGLLEAGCKPEVSVVATHALFVGPAVKRLQPLPIRELIVTNTVDITPELPAQLRVVDVAGMIADAISHLHRDQSSATISTRRTMSEPSLPIAPEAPLSQLERALIDDYVRARGYDPLKLADLPEAERDGVLKDASIYASGKLTEVESRSHFIEEIHDVAPGSIIP